VLEGGTREPFIVRWPKHVRSGTSDALVCQIDLVRSLASLTVEKLAKEAAPDSVDVLPALLGQCKSGRETLVEQGRNIAVRQEKWKLIEPDRAVAPPKGKQRPSANSAQPQLYNLANDLAEQRNLARQRPEKVKELQKLLDNIRRSGRMP
jgi:arylsulfatase A-like enzyme